MRIITIVLILYLIEVSVCGILWGSDSKVETTTSEIETEEDGFDMKNEKLQVSDPDEDDEEENGDNSDVSNQDDDQDITVETTLASAVPAQPNNNVDQNRGLPGSTENLPPPDYSAVNMRGYLPSTCHSGQYQCQKQDPNAPTRCIPQEWRCNGLRDCEESDDESGCSTDQLSRGRTQAKCTQEQYQCHGSGINSVPPHCIERRNVCDGTYHCSYGDDEANCGDRRQPPVYPNRIPQRNDNTPQTNEQTSGRADPRDTYRPQPQAQPQPNSNDRKSEEYVQRLEWRDRCFRSCLKY